MPCGAVSWTSWSLDLIQGLPQPLECGDLRGHWNGQLEQAIALEPPHLSVYDLIVEPGTVFARRQDRGDLSLPEEELAADLMDLTWSRLTGGGYGHYEISNYALPGHASRHNRVYWSGGGWWGFGMGATSAVAVTAWPDPAPVRGTPNGCEARNSRHLNLQALQETQPLPDAAGRTADGGSAPTGRGEYGGHSEPEYDLPAGRVQELRYRLQSFEREGLLVIEGPRWRLSDPAGLALSNGVLRELLDWWECPASAVIQPRRAATRQAMTVQQGGAEGWLAQAQSQQIGGDPYLAITVIPGADTDHRNRESATQFPGEACGHMFHAQGQNNRPLRGRGPGAAGVPD